MANMNLTTSPDSDVYLNTEIKLLKSIGHKISRVDLLNIILQEISDDSDVSHKVRQLVIGKLDDMKIVEEQKLIEIKNKFRGTN